jgi:hypothetical protein
LGTRTVSDDFWKKLLTTDGFGVRDPALFENVQLFQPSHKGVCCSMGVFLARRAFRLVQDFVALIDSWSNLLLASKARRVIEIGWNFL